MASGWVGVAPGRHALARGIAGVALEECPGEEGAVLGVSESECVRVCERVYAYICERVCLCVCEREG